MIKISFVLPCYNVAPYVGRCIESIEKQDIDQAEYEVICVDDCSTDSTAEVIKEYQHKYQNVRLYQHTVNKTAGGARNTGMKNAQGQYIWFVDPDDSIEPNVLSKVFEQAADRNADLLFFNYNYIDERGVLSRREQYQTIEEVIEGRDFVLKFCPQKHLAEITSIYRCLYRRMFCTDHRLEYPEIKASQDVIFIWKCLLEAKRVSSISDVCYNYWRRLNSTTGNKGKFKADSVLSACLLYPCHVYGIAKIYNLSGSPFYTDLQFAIRNAVNDHSRKILLMGRTQKKIFYQLMKKNSATVDLLKSYMNRKTRILLDYRIPRWLWLCATVAYSIHDQ